MKDIIATVSGVATRRTCKCDLCRAYREEPTVVIRTLEENRKRAGVKGRTQLEQRYSHPISQAGAL